MIEHKTKKKKILTKPTKISNETNGVRINWKSVSGVEGYYVYRSDITSYQGDWSKVATIKSPSTKSYFDETVKSGRTYAYRVKAYYGKAVSASESLITEYIAAPKITSVKNEKDGIGAAGIAVGVFVRNIMGTAI